MKHKHDPHDDYTAPTRTPDFTEDSRDECSLVNFRCRLKKIPSNFYTIEIGEQLDIRIDGINVLTAHNGEVAFGNIASSFNGTIVTCIRNHRKFKAQVLNHEGDVQVFCT